MSRPETTGRPVSPVPGAARRQASSRGECERNASSFEVRHDSASERDSRQLFSTGDCPLRTGGEIVLCPFVHSRVRGTREQIHLRLFEQDAAYLRKLAENKGLSVSATVTSIIRQLRREIR